MFNDDECSAVVHDNNGGRWL